MRLKCTDRLLDKHPDFQKLPGGGYLHVNECTYYALSAAGMGFHSVKIKSANYVLFSQVWYDAVNFLHWLETNEY